MPTLETLDGSIIFMSDEHALIFPTLQAVMDAGDASETIYLPRIHHREMVWIISFLNVFYERIIFPWTSESYDAFVQENCLNSDVEMFFDANLTDMWDLLQALDYLGGGCLYFWLLFYVKAQFRLQASYGDGFISNHT
jgi:hypothetical protein